MKHAESTQFSARERKIQVASSGREGGGFPRVDHTREEHSELELIARAASCEACARIVARVPRSPAFELQFENDENARSENRISVACQMCFVKLEIAPILGSHCDSRMHDA